MILECGQDSSGLEYGPVRGSWNFALHRTPNFCLPERLLVFQEWFFSVVPGSSPVHKFNGSSLWTSTDITSVRTESNYEPWHPFGTTAPVFINFPTRFRLMERITPRKTYETLKHVTWYCRDSVSSCNIYVIQLDTQCFYDWVLFITFSGSTCFGPQWSILRSVFKLYVANLVCGILRTTRYVQMLCGYRKNCTYQICNIQLENAPEDGPLRSETCRTTKCYE